MTIQNKQVEDAGKALSASASPPATGAGKGAFWTKTVSGIVEGFYVDSNGNQIQITSNGSLLGGGGGAVNSVNGETGTVVLDKTDIGLGNVDNTSDANKPISSATQSALDAKQATLALPSQAEAEAGVATTPRSWSAERVAQAIAALAEGGGGSANEFQFVLPAAATLALRIPSVAGLPANWSLATADTAGEGNFGSNIDTLVITWDPALSTKIAQEITVFQTTTSGPAATQGIQKFPLTAAAEQKTNTAKTKGAAFLSGKGIDPAKELTVFIKLI